VKGKIAMRKPVGLVVIIVLLLTLVPSRTVRADITILQDKDGNITLTNEYNGKKKSRYIGKSRKNRIINSVSSLNVPKKYLSKIRKYARKYNVKEKLVIAVCRAESGFNPFAVSHKGAVGIMQLMKDTALQYGVVNRYNVDQNLDAGIRHLKYLYEKYNRNLSLTLAAYNAGENAIKKYGGVPPYKETRTYIKRVKRYMGIPFSRESTSLTSGAKIYQYRNAQGKIVITDTYPSHAKGIVTVFD
jgi:soluble lytic murein transglycosylase-like protein